MNGVECQANKLRFHSMNNEKPLDKPKKVDDTSS